MTSSILEYSAVIVSLSADEFKALVELALEPDVSEFLAPISAGAAK